MDNNMEAISLKSPHYKSIINLDIDNTMDMISLILIYLKSKFRI